MKRTVMILIGLLAAFGTYFAMGQGQTENERMGQDIEVAENILSTLIKQQFGKKVFFPVDVHGSYTSGFGVTFRLPQNSGAFTMIKMAGMENIYGPEIMIAPSPDAPAISYSYSYSSDGRGEREEKRRTSEDDRRVAENEKRIAEGEKKMQQAQKESAEGQRKTATKVRKAAMLDRDSLRIVADKRFLDVAKNFLADYGDVLSQLKPDERILITNRGEGFDRAFPWGGEARRSLISVEAKRDDITQLRQGKLTRDQFLGKLKVVNSESTDKLDPDLEVFASMFSRLYREDLSKTYYSEGDVNYERMKDFGVIYYMRVYSSVEQDERKFYIPTIATGNLNQVERDKKVKELYPAFEASIKDNLVEYGRTIHSLKDEEQIVFNIRLTKCDACGIPESIEVSVKASVLKDYAAGKLNKLEAMEKMNVKKVGFQ
jgi:hypothetical protein